MSSVGTKVFQILTWKKDMALKQVAVTEKAYEVLTEKVREIKESGKSSSAVALVSELIIDNFAKEQAKA